MRNIATVEHAGAVIPDSPTRRRAGLWQELVPAVRATAVTLVLLGLAYPLAMTGLSQLLFPRQASGSLVADGTGKVVGSELLAQGFSGPAYFHPRPSAAGEKGYDATSSGGSNLGPTSKKLHDQAAAALAALGTENPEAQGPPPVELVTASASGLDPDLSPRAALWQVARVARARGIDPARLRSIVEEAIEGRDLGILGEPRVNVLRLNLELDARLGAPRVAAGS